MKIILHYLFLLSLSLSLVGQEGGDFEIEKVVVPASEQHPELWVYYPKGKEKEKLVTVLASAAGSNLFHGMEMMSGDEVEFSAYAEAGMAVVAFGTKAPLVEGKEEESLTQFVSRKGGVLDGGAALQAASQKFSFVDGSRLYVAGHSSAGTLALAIGQASKNVKGVVAYAPVTDLSSRLTLVTTLYPNVAQDYQEFLKGFSPVDNTKALNCPVFLFRAKEDKTVRAEDTFSYRESLGANEVPYTYVEVDGWDHYQTMIDDGLKEGVAWIQKMETGWRPELQTLEVESLRGKTLTIPLRPGMSMYADPKEVERYLSKDNYRVYWKDKDDLSEVMIGRLKEDAQWEDALAEAEKRRIVLNEKIAKEPEVLQKEGRDTEYSQPARIGLEEGLFRGYFMSRTVFQSKDGSGRVTREMFAWDQKDLWSMVYTGDEANWGKVLDLIGSIEFSSEGEK